jgi:hypothetical protein
MGEKNLEINLINENKNSYGLKIYNPNDSGKNITQQNA